MKKELPEEFIGNLIELLGKEEAEKLAVALAETTSL